MKAVVIAALVSAITTAPSVAGPYTIEECSNLYIALQKLDHNPAGGQYRMPDARLAIALDMEALRPTYEASQRAHLDISVAVSGKREEKDLTPVDNKKIQDDWMNYIRGTCPVTNLRHIDYSALNVGDGEKQNAIPPSIIGLLKPILDNIPEK